MRKNAGVLALTFLLLCLSSAGFSGVVSVQNIAFAVPGTWYYIADGGVSRFEMSSTGTANIQSYGVLDPTIYDYAVDNVVLTISACPLVPPDRSSGGRAMADFEDGGILTFTGDLRERNGTEILYSGTILQAELAALSGSTFALEETTASSSQVSGTVGLVGMGGLSSGITASNGDLFVIGDMAMKLQFLTIGVTSFQNSLMSQAPSVHITGTIPEPASVLLLAFGGIGMIFRKR